MTARHVVADRVSIQHFISGHAVDINRPLTVEERCLARWMLEHGSPKAKDFLPQLEVAEATPWRCPCGCASFNFQIKGHRIAPPGTRIIADFVFGYDDSLSGVFMFESAGILKGLEVYGLAGDAPASLPTPELLRPFECGVKASSRNRSDER